MPHFTITCIGFLGLHNEVPSTRWLKQQNLIFSRFWRLESYDQGVSKFGFFLGLSPWLAGDHLPAVSLYCLSSVWLGSHLLFL